MFYYSGPVAKRTRSREAQMFKELYEKNKKQRKGEQENEKNGVESTSKVQARKGKGVGLSRIQKKDNVDVGLGFDVKIVGESDAFEPEGADVEEIGGNSWNNGTCNSVESEGALNLRVRNGENNELVERDNELVVLGEKECLEPEKEDECVLIISDDENSLSSKELRQSGGLNFDCGEMKKNQDKDLSKSEVVNMISGSDNEERSDDSSTEDDASTEEYSQEDNDDPNDADYGAEISQNSASPVESDSDSSDDDEETFVASKVVERGSGYKAKGSGVNSNSEESGVQNSEVSATLDVLRCCTAEDNECVEILKEQSGMESRIQLDDVKKHKKWTSTCVAKRSRSYNSDHGKKEINQGMASGSLPVKELDSSTSGDDNSDDDNDNDVSATKASNRRCDSEGKHEMLKCSKGNLNSARKVNFLHVLANSLLDKGEVPLEELVPFTDESPNEQTNKASIPLKFTFGVEETPEKSEYEKELDKLWVEMDCVLRSCEIGVADSIMVGMKDAIHKEVEQDESMLCLQGHHQFILDEEVGILCKYCSFVQTEIKHIIPPFKENQCGRFRGRCYGVGDFSVFDDLWFEDSNQFGSAPYTRTEGTVWENIPGAIRTLYPHQREGFEFIWKNIAGGIYRDKSKNPSNGGSGCIISHAPGTGKTRLVIVFLQSYMKENPHCRPLIVAPRSMLLTWEEEFEKWGLDVPFYNLNKPELTGKERLVCINTLEKYKRGIRDMDLARRLVKLYSWKCDSGILGISYRLFEQLAGRYKSKEQCNTLHDNTLKEKISRILLEIPDLIVLDEGHTPRNDNSLIWKALTQIKTERRIILSGTPFQNNFDELFNTLRLVRPKFAERIRCGHQESIGSKRGRKSDEAKQKWMSLTSSIMNVAHNKSKGKGLKELRDMIKPFVHVHKGTILNSLPGLRKFMVILRPTDVQKKLLDGLQGEKQFFLFDYCVSLISVHPSLLGYCVGREKEIGRDRVEELTLMVGKDNLESNKLNADVGVKTRFLLELIRLSEALNEKVLVFSQYIEPLNLIKDQLEAHFCWREGQELLYMDGKRDVRQRQSSINAFNDPRSKARVLLASTRACSEGINLVGGSRVVLLDVTWNPSIERQAISRAYRLGQTKIVYIYHLICCGTIDEDKYWRQAGKERLSELVFSVSDSNRDNKGNNFYGISEDQILELLFHNQNLKPIFEKIVSQPKESAYDGNGNWIFADKED